MNLEETMASFHLWNVGLRKQIVALGLAAALTALGACSIFGSGSSRYRSPWAWSAVS
jgi:hypothetical protein